MVKLLFIVLAMTSISIISALQKENTVRNGSESKPNNNMAESTGPVLICLLFKNLGCNVKCSTTASAFSLRATGRCTNMNICQCTIKRDESLEGLFRAKFKDAEDALERIKKDADLSAKVLKILRVPFQVIAKTRDQISEVVYPAISTQLSVEDNTPAWKLHLVEETDEFDDDQIKKYVSEKLKSILKSASKQLTNMNYKSNMKNLLQGKSNENLQSIVNEVRQTKNKNLNDIVDEYLKTSKIIEKNSFKRDSIADVIGYQVIDQFISYIEQNKNLAGKELARKQTMMKGKKSESADEKSAKREKSSSAKENTKKSTKSASG